MMTLDEKNRENSLENATAIELPIDLNYTVFQRVGVEALKATFAQGARL